MKKQRILSALLALCLVFSMLPTALAAGADGFTDVGKDSWCYDYVDYVTSEGYFHGTTDTTFSPNRNMTRAMFVVVLARFDDMKVDNSQSSFTDVEPGSWCAGAIEWAAENGIVTGKGDGRFAPNDPITRAQMCAIMDRYLDYYTAKHDVVVEQKGKASTLADQSQVPSYATAAVRNCQKYGLINGYEDGTFRPQAYSTRAHVAAIIYRLSFLVAGAKDANKYGVCPNCGALVSVNSNRCSECKEDLSGGGHFKGNGGHPDNPPSPPPIEYTYQLTYDANGGQFADDKTTKSDSVKSGTKEYQLIPNVENPRRVDHVFLGWSVNKDAKEPDALPIKISADTTLYAVWGEPGYFFTYVVTYDANGVEFVNGVPDPVEVEVESPAEDYEFTPDPDMEEPRREGCEFRGWSVNENATEPDELPIKISGDTTLYAVWLPIDQYTYELTYMDGDTPLKTETSGKTPVKDTSWKFPVYDLEDTDTAAFMGWSLTNGGAVEYAKGEAVKLEAPETKKTVYAVWTATDDYIGNAVQDAIDQANREYINTFNSNATVKDGAGNVLAKSTVSITNVNFDQETQRDLTLAITAKVDEALVTSILEKASKIALDMLPQVDPGEIGKEEVKSMVQEIVEAFEKATGIDISSLDVEIITEKVYDKLLEAGSSLWQNFNDGAGKYYTGDVTVSVEGVKTATILVNEGKGNPTTLDGSKRTAVVKTAEAIAKAMYADLKKYTGDYVSAVKMDSVVTLKFSAPANEYKESTDSHPYIYNVNVVLDLNGGGLVKYKFVEGTGSYVKLVISKEVQNEYTETVDSVVTGALDNETVQKKLESKIDAAVDTFKDNSTFKSLINALVNKIGMTEVEANGLVDAAMNSWKQDNMDVADLANSPMFDLYWKQSKDAGYVNDAVYDLVTEVAEKAAVYADDTVREQCEKNFSAPIAANMLDTFRYTATPDDLKETLYKQGIEFGLDAHPKLEKYVLAVVSDYMNDKATSPNPNKPGPYVDTYLAGMQAEIDELIQEKLEETSYFKYLEQVRAVRTIKTMETVELGQAAELLEKLTDKTDIDLSAYDSQVEKVLNQIDRLPGNVSIEVDTYTLSKEALTNAFGGVATAEEFYDALIELMNEYPGLSLADFTGEGGVPVTVKYNNRTFTFHLVIEIA